MIIRELPLLICCIQYEVQQDARRIIIRQQKGRLCLAPYTILSDAARTYCLLNRQLGLRSSLISFKILSPLVNLPFLSSPLAFVPIYLWSRRHPSTPISLFGLITITAPYLPLALVALAWVLNGTWRAAAGDLLGCAVGHVGWFMRDVWSREMVGGPTVFSDAPDVL